MNKVAGLIRAVKFYAELIIENHSKFRLFFLFHQINNLLIVFDMGELWYHDMQIQKFIELFLRCFEETSTELVIAALIYIERLLDATSKIVGEDGARVT